ncbi:hypothetical protein E2C01_034283 [Portunus trituberculatus]|uniref:Reverse transcriptase domain-containing protein n=1 Tax=Portunus trituberculatus TaxID=210409 RepID=A0A5B7F6K6_PORTR|nr:hypothetical protein [Portunus trituberculatus]
MVGDIPVHQALFFLVLRAFSKLLRVEATRQADAGVSALLYVDDWLIHAPTKEDVLGSFQKTLEVLVEIG